MTKQPEDGQEPAQHKNDMYGNIEARDEQDAGVIPPIPAATIVLLRDSPDGIDVLMLKKNSNITFGGMWVFPGGKIDQDDYDGTGDDLVAARNAAAREAQEEANLALPGNDFVWFAHWTPPPGPQKRFATWFFAADTHIDVEGIAIDDGEIKDHAWINPREAIAAHARHEIDLVPPTWVTLHHFSLYASVDALMQSLRAQEPRYYSTHVAKRTDGVRVAMWDGDAGYDAWDADIEGPRHRLVMAKDGFVFENTVISYG